MSGGELTICAGDGRLILLRDSRRGRLVWRTVSPRGARDGAIDDLELVGVRDGVRLMLDRLAELMIRDLGADADDARHLLTTTPPDGPAVVLGLPRVQLIRGLARRLERQPPAAARRPTGEFGNAGPAELRVRGGVIPV